MVDAPQTGLRPFLSRWENLITRTLSEHYGEKSFTVAQAERFLRNKKGFTAWEAEQLVGHVLSSGLVSGKFEWSKDSWKAVSNVERLPIIGIKITFTLNGVKGFRVFSPPMEAFAWIIESLSKGGWITLESVSWERSQESEFMVIDKNDVAVAPVKFESERNFKRTKENDLKINYDEGMPE